MRVDVMLPAVRAVAVGAVLCGIGVGAGSASAAVPSYSLVGSYALPEAGPWDYDRFDGRVVRMSGVDIYKQDAVNGSSYTKIGSLPAGSVSGTGASFIRYSPFSFRIAIGDGNFGAGASVHLINFPGQLNPSTPTTPQTLSVPNYDAAWLNDDVLMVTGGDLAGSYVNTIDAGRAQPVYRSLNAVGGASGGITTGPAGVYVGSGFMPQGEVRSFNPGVFWTPTVNPPSPVNFSTGAYVATVLSGGPLAADTAGNLIIGGADYSSGAPVGGVWVVNAANPAERQFLDPAGGSALYSLAFNRFTSELVLASGGTAYRFAIPAPGAAALLAACGVVAARRRRRG